jgi:PhnB protein
MSSKPIHGSIAPYLFFDGRCEEAIEFYRQAVGAEVLMQMRFKESPDTNSCAPGNGEKIMHASLRLAGSTVLVSDGRCTGNPTFQGFALSVTATTPEEAERIFGALVEGGQVQMPLTQTFFSPRFGMLADRFGVSWMVYVVPPSV